MKKNIFCIMGKSGTGKDTIYKKLVEKLSLQPIPLYTTRPMRNNEENGREYYFVQDIPAENVIECREYHTVNGVWKYALVDDGQFMQDGILITTPAGIRAMRSYWEKDPEIVLWPIQICVPERERINRLYQRERSLENPNYKEIDRRILTDQTDFKNIEFTYASFYNEDAGQCAQAIAEYISACRENTRIASSACKTGLR